MKGLLRNANLLRKEAKICSVFCEVPSFDCILTSMAMRHLFHHTVADINPSPLSLVLD